MPDVSGLGDGTPSAHPHLPSSAGLDPIPTCSPAWGCAVDENGWVVHDPAGRTSIAGVWVAGNTADPRAQVITAAGQGSTAAVALNADLVDEDGKRALANHGTATRHGQPDQRNAPRRSH